MMASSKYENVQVPDLPNWSDFNSDILDSSVGWMSDSDLDHLLQASRPETCALVDSFAANELEWWDESKNLTRTLLQGDLLGLDSSGIDGNCDSASLDPWYGALTQDFDLLPNLQTDNLSLDLVQNPGAAEWSMPLEESSADVASSISAPITSSNSYQPTPGMTECSTAASLFSSNSSRDPTLRSLGSFDTDNERWHATLLRSRTADSYFVYGVLTTKIFCRPSCASRRPSRRHVKFFPFPGATEAAKQAKFRPCKRCKPEALGTGNNAVLAISQVLRRIVAETFKGQNEAEKEVLKLESLAKLAGLSTFHFHRLFKATTQVTPADFITACHALALQDHLCTYSSQETESNPCAVQLPPRWSQRTARKALGDLNPEEYANGAKATSIEYCRVPSPVGELEVAYSRDKKFSRLLVHATRLLQGSSVPIGRHFGTSKKSEEYAQCFRQCVGELGERCKDRDAEIAADVLSVLWRARMWLKITHDNGIR